MAIIEKLEKSFEATKESYSSWIAFGVCLAVAALCALAGIMIWVAEYIGAVLSCFLFSGIFVLAAGIVKFVIDAKEKEAAKKLDSAKREIKRDVATVAKPLKVAYRSMPRSPFPVALLGLLAGVAILTYYTKTEEASSV